MKTIEKKYLLPFCLVTVLFLLWGIANNMTDTLLSAFKRIMSMSDTQTSLIQFAFYGSYFCFALPAALYIRKYSYKVAQTETKKTDNNKGTLNGLSVGWK